MAQPGNRSGGRSGALIDRFRTAAWGTAAPEDAPPTEPRA